MADNHAHDDYVRGSMEISEQESTFKLFIFLAKYGSLTIAAVLSFLTIWFMPNGNFFGGFIVMVVMMVVGIFALRSKPAAH
ncbi:MAG: aa3-type cytochrome c oxidase subunit IV [Brevundimonas sp.]|nr:aa3-type cytochrome c oxidase subunit IV [Brevundimonas sp.]